MNKKEKYDMKPIVATMDRALKKLKIKTPTLKQQCDALWITCVKARAGFKSELSGIEGKKIGGTAILASHHILGKATYRLRYSLDNGICLINGKEHIFGVHNHNPAIAIDYFKRIVDYIGGKRYKKLLMLEQVGGKTDLTMAEIYLEKKLIELTGNTKSNNNKRLLKKGK